MNTGRGCIGACILGVLTLAALLNANDSPSAGSILWLLFLLGTDGSIIVISVTRRRRQRELEAHAYAVQVAQSQHIAPYHAMSPRQFEEALAFLCHRDGCTSVQVVGGAGDLGADVIAISPTGQRIVIQAKRYGPTTKVSGPDLQKFGGTCFAVHRANVAAVVTTSVFTKQAMQYAQHMGIRLLSERELAGWASRTAPAPWH